MINYNLKRNQTIDRHEDDALNAYLDEHYSPELCCVDGCFKEAEEEYEGYPYCPSCYHDVLLEEED